MRMPPAKRRRVTVCASRLGIIRAEKALLRLGFDSKSNFAKTQLMSKSTVDKFFNQQSIQLDSFKRICDALREDWGNIAELEPVVAQCASESAEKTVESSVAVETIPSQPVKMQLTATRQITVADRDKGEVRCEIILKGDVALIDDRVQQTLETIIRNFSGHTITIIDIQSGSIKITLQGSQRDVAKLVDRITSGELTVVNGFPVEDVQLLNQEFLEELDENGSSEMESLIQKVKWDLIQRIISDPVQQRQLSGCDLSNADLSGANLVGADLSKASLRETDLSRTDLIGANLNGASLIEANLHEANLSGANLHEADLIGANLYRTNLIGADLSRTDFIGVDFSEAYLIRANLVKAIFIGAILIRANLHQANLHQVNLHRANLYRANLNGANLNGANLHRANLTEANLNGTNLEGANLIGANLIRANLSEADLATAIVEKARFGEGIGLTEAQKLDLQRRGAIFNDSTGDRSFVLR